MLEYCCTIPVSHHADRRPYSKEQVYILENNFLHKHLWFYWYAEGMWIVFFFFHTSRTKYYKESPLLFHELSLDHLNNTIICTLYIIWKIQNLIEKEIDSTWYIIYILRIMVNEGDCMIFGVIKNYWKLLLNSYQIKFF